MDVTKGHVPELFELALEGRLTPQQKERLEKHVAKCGECAADLEFARKARAVLKSSAERGPELERLAAVEAGVSREISGEAVPRSFLSAPVLVGSAAVALLVLWIMPKATGGFGWLSTRSAVELSGSVGGAGYQEQETRMILRAVDSLHYQRGAAGGSSVVPLLVTDFESYRDLSGVVFLGSVASNLGPSAIWGSSSLRLVRMAAPDETIVVDVPLQTYVRCPNTAAVSVWAFCSGPSRISLEVAVAGGGSYKASPLRDVDAGKWMWAVFEVPDGLRGAGVGIESLRFTVEGKGDLSLDRIELWCGR